MKNWSTTKKVVVGILFLLLIAALLYQFTNVFGNEKGFFGDRTSNTTNRAAACGNKEGSECDTEFGCGTWVTGPRGCTCKISASNRTADGKCPKRSNA